VIQGSEYEAISLSPRGLALCLQAAQPPRKYGLELSRNPCSFAWTRRWALRELRRAQGPAPAGPADRQSSHAKACHHHAGRPETQRPCAGIPTHPGQPPLVPICCIIPRIFLNRPSTSCSTSARVCPTAGVEQCAGAWRWAPRSGVAASGLGHRADHGFDAFELLSPCESCRRRFSLSCRVIFIRPPRRAHPFESCRIC